MASLEEYYDIMSKKFDGFVRRVQGGGSKNICYLLTLK
jgi:hypothetical protein